MKKKYIFFDIDGTLTDENPGGEVLPSTHRTLKKLKENGHFVSLATGRANYFTVDFAKENNFDNIVSDGGNGLTINNKLIDIEPLDYDLCLEVINECLDKDVAFGVLIKDEPIFYTSSKLPYRSDMEISLIRDFDFSKVDKIFKIFIQIKEEHEKELTTIHKMGYIRYHEDHLIVEAMDKYHGIEKMVNMIGGNLEDIVVFGDGKNDISMMIKAPVSIAMGNAIDELKENATFVTKSNKEDGIEFACKHFGWID